jgi:asparagine synthetase B (glutamine-hydrolysing)
MYFKTLNPQLATLRDPLQLLRLFANMDGGPDMALQFLDREFADEDYVNSSVIDASGHFPAQEFPHEALNQLAFFELGFGLPGWELDQADRLYMDRSIELRPAFLENGFVDYALTIPSELKRDKGVLKHAMRGLLPDTIINRPKYPSLGTPRSVYRQPWFKEGLRDLFDHPLDIWDTQQIRRLSKQNPEQFNLDIVYRLVYLQTWHRHCLAVE